MVCLEISIRGMFKRPKICCNLVVKISLHLPQDLLIFIRLPATTMLTTVKRWLRFNAIGLMGTGVQLLLIFLLRTFFQLNYFVATLIGVQCSLIHNFFWHQHWTWKNSLRTGRKESFQRFLRFNSTSGTISMMGNLGFTSVLVQAVHLPYFACNILAIGGTNILNFFLANNFAFQPAES
jgi:putative flippase GtrA